MGYSNYYYTKSGLNRFPDKFLKDAERAVEIYNEKNPEDTVVLRKYSPTCIGIEGPGVKYEGFDFDLDDNDFDFCKTNMYPYDTIVKALLMIGKDDGVVEKWHFDGEVGDEEYKAAKEIVDAATTTTAQRTRKKIDNGMIKGVLVDVYNEKAEVVELKPELDEYYKILNCDMIEIATRKIGRKVFDIVCDEEGTFVEDPKISAISNIGRPMLVGNILVLGQSTDGKENGLTPAEVKYVMDRVVKLRTNHWPEGYPMLTQVEYA